MTKQKLVRPQMTTEARDILKSWDGETNSEKVKAMDAFCAFAVHHSEVMHNECVKTKKENEVLKISFIETSTLNKAELVTKTKELSTIARYPAISICVNLVAIGWIAWTNGWLS